MLDQSKKISLAIDNLNQIEFDYKGYHRIACPHILGLKNNKEQVLVYQFDGESSKKLAPNGEWRCVEIASIKNLKIIEGAWHTKPATQKSTCVDNIVNKVKLPKGR
jgi:hypothetical protein